MNNLPVKAKAYLIGTYIFGVILISYALFFSPVRRPALSWEMALFLGIAIFAYGKKITLMRHKGVADAGSMSLGFAITFAAILRLGPTGGMLVAAVGCLSSCLYPKRQPPYHVILVNDADHTVDYVVIMMQKVFGKKLSEYFWLC